MPVPRISKEELKQRLDSSEPDRGPLILDARLKYPYEHSTVRLPGAIRVPPYEPLDISRLPRDREIVVYDSDPDELVSARVAAELIRRGFRAFALKGGIAEWMSANYPFENKEAPKAAAPAPGSLKG
jgi:rhodanese-related sulfurtransferase